MRRRLPISNIHYLRFLPIQIQWDKNAVTLIPPVSFHSSDLSHDSLGNNIDGRILKLSLLDRWKWTVIARHLPISRSVSLHQIRKSYAMISIVNILFGTFFLLRQVISLGPVPGVPLSQQTPTIATSTLNAIKIPSESPAYHCSDPSDDIFQIRRFDFTPTNVRM